MKSEEYYFKKVCEDCRSKGNEGKLCDDCKYIRRDYIKSGGNKENEELEVMEFE